MAEKLDLKDERVLVLYTELAPYVLACLNAFVERTGAHVDLVRWPGNKEAPFALEFHKNISVHDRNSFSDAQLVEFALAQNPSLVMASGWVDKGYLRTCRKLRSKGIPSVMTFDTAWRGGPKQWVQAAMGRIWIHRTFSHAWATGSKQAEYAAKLGFAKDRIHTGFYAADTASFLKTYRNSKHERRAHFPHRFICVARYIPTKGQQTLCDAFAALCDAGEAADWDLHFVGVGEQHREVSESTSGSHPRITHRGFVQAKDMPATLRKSGVAILPSLYEPWGVVVQEFACMGLPLLLSDAVGARERFLKEGENGFVHLAGDEEDIKRTLKNIIAKTDDQLFNMGERSNELGGAWTPEDWAHVVEGSLKRTT